MPTKQIAAARREPDAANKGDQLGNNGLWR